MGRITITKPDIPEPIPFLKTLIFLLLPVCSRAINRTYGYNSYGQLIWAMDPYEKQTSYNIDGWGRLIDVTDDAGNKQTIEYDIYNRTKTAGFIPYGTTNEENNYTEEYDQWGRITVRKGYPDGTENPGIQESYEYDLVGNLIKVTDPRGNSTRFHYDPLNRIKRVTNPLGETIDVDYDRLGSLTKLNQYEGSNTFTTTKIYDDRGSLLSQQPPTGPATTYKYNSLGLPVEINEGGAKITTFQYDNSNHLQTKTAGIYQYQYSYDPLGGLDKCEVFEDSVPGEHLDYDYNSTGRIKERTVGSFTTKFEYDLVGNRTKVEDHFDYAVDYEYNDLHRLEEITAGNKTFSYEYHPDGMISAVNYPVTAGGSLRKEMLYDNLNRLTEIKNLLGGSPISRYNYTYDNNGNIIAITENGTETTYYTYDALNRMTGINRPNGETIAYEYDSRGNRTLKTGITQKEEYFIPADFTYTVWNELETFKNTLTDETYTYGYDAEGLRSKKTSPTGSTLRYHVDNSGRVIAESNASDQVTAQNIWGHKILARKIGAAYYYYLYNGHGDVVQILDEAGTIVNSYSYDEWGNIRSKTEGIANPIRYAGEYYDEESGLYNLRARYYDPVIARFITKDSYEGVVANPLSINQYIYCWNNPLIYIDPSGHWADQAGLQNMLDSGEIDNYTISHVPGVGETITVTQGGSTLTITDNKANDYFDYTERIHDLMGFGNDRPSSLGEMNPDNVTVNAKPTQAKEEEKRAVIKAVQLDIGNQGYYGSPIYSNDMYTKMNNLITPSQAIKNAILDTLKNKVAANAIYGVFGFTLGVKICSDLDDKLVSGVENSTFSRVWTAVGILTVFEIYAKYVEGYTNDIVRTFKTNLIENMQNTKMILPDIIY